MPSFEGAKRALVCSQIWDVALAAGRTHTYTDNSKSGSPGQNLNRVARTLFSRGRLISEASLPVFQRGWGRTYPNLNRGQDTRLLM